MSVKLCEFSVTIIHQKIKAFKEWGQIKETEGMKGKWEKITGKFREQWALSRASFLGVGIISHFLQLTNRKPFPWHQIPYRARRQMVRKQCSSCSNLYLSVTSVLATYEYCHFQMENQRQSCLTNIFRTSLSQNVFQRSQVGEEAAGGEWGSLTHWL